MHCGFAAISGRGDRLSISMVPYIACREDSWNISLSFVLRHNVSLLIEIDDSFEDLGVRLIAYSDEDPISCQRRRFSTLHILKSYSADLLISQNLSHLRIPSKLDSGIIHHSVLHDLAGPQLVPPMDNRDLKGCVLKSTFDTSSYIISGPNLSACLRKFSINSGPRMLWGKPGKFSTSEVIINCPPGMEPARSKVFLPALHE